MRIVSHTCSNTEILCALGLADALVGVDDHSDYPPAVVRQLPRIGPDLAIDIAKIQALKPDLVVTSLTVPGHEQCLQQLEQAGLPVLVTEPLQLADVASDIETIAAATGVSARGQALAQQFRERLAHWQTQAVKHSALPVLVEWWPKPVIVPAQDSWVNQMLTLAGAYNPWQHTAGKSVVVDNAAAQQAAPAAIVMSWCGVNVSKYHPHVVLRRAGWEQIPAIQHAQVYPVSEAYLGRPGPRLLQGIEQLAAIVKQVRGTNA